MPHVLHLAPEVVKIDLQTPFPVAHIIYNIVGQKTYLFIYFFITSFWELVEDKT